MTDSREHPGRGRPRRAFSSLLIAGLVVLSVLLTVPVATTASGSSPDSNVVSAASGHQSAQSGVEFRFHRTSTVATLGPVGYSAPENPTWFDAAWPANGSDSHQSDWLHADTTRTQYGSSPESDTRTRIFELIREDPGAHVSAVSERSEFHRSTVRHHIHELEKANQITTSKIQGKRRLFPAGEKDRAAKAALADDTAATVLSAVFENEPVTVSALATDLDRSASTVSYHLDRLDSLSMVTRERRGNEVLVSVTPAAGAALSDRTDVPMRSVNTTVSETD